MIEKLLNWSEISRYIGDCSRTNIRKKQINKKYWSKIDSLIYNELPEWWEKFKREHE